MIKPLEASGISISWQLTWWVSMAITLWINAIAKFSHWLLGRLRLWSNSWQLTSQTLFNFMDLIFCSIAVSVHGWSKSMEVLPWLPTPKRTRSSSWDFLMTPLLYSIFKNCKYLFYCSLTGEEEQIGGFDLICRKYHNLPLQKVSNNTLMIDRQKISYLGTQINR